MKFLDSALNVEAAAQEMLAERTRERHPRFLPQEVDDGYDYSQRVPQGVTALHLVAYFGANNIVDHLLAQSDLDVEDSNQQTPILFALRYGNATTAKLLLERGADPGKRDRYDRNTLLWAAKNGHTLVVTLLLQNGGIQVNAKDKYGMTSLQWAAWEGHEAIASLLLNHGADMEVGAEDGITPLVLAIEGNSDAVVSLLVQGGAQLDAEYRIKTVYKPLKMSYKDLRESTWDDPLLRGLGYLCEPSRERKAAGDSFNFKKRVEFLDFGSEIDLVLTGHRIRLLRGKTGVARTPLFRAAEKGLESIAEILINNGAKVGSANNLYQLLLLESFLISQGVVDNLLKHGSRVYGIAGLDPLFLAVASDSWEEAKQLLDSGANANCRCAGYNLTPLDVAVFRGDEKFAELLLENGAIVKTDSRDEEGRTVLHWAAERSLVGITQLLLDHGAEIDIQDDDHYTPLLIAVEGGAKEVVELLLQNGAAVDSRDITGHTGLHFAAFERNQEIVQLLLNYGSQVDSKRHDGVTPLYIATSMDDPDEEVVELLLKKGADVNLLSKYSRTLLAVAARKGNKRMLELLLAAEKVEVDRKSHDGSTPLSIAVKNGHEEAVKMLLATNAVNIQSEDAFGRSVLWWAKRQGHHNIRKLLIEDARRRGITLPDVDVPERGYAGSGKVVRACDICDLLLFKDSVFYHCGTCNGGDFDLCVDCVAVGAHCLDKSHGVTKEGTDESSNLDP
ncbi:hypothetical protein TWF481_005025 [Arthrobotrys musiformis]|uniref:Uncharacterized protein n=1 Tax=Arthrobotrys musiformis TaxID=47236 RepID=A0AAV9WNA1_9PEZI